MQTESLKEKYAPYFKVGAAINKWTLERHEALIKKHFNRVTCDNAMKFVSLQRQPGKYFFDHADKIATFAKENDIALHGHNFVWHQQTPDFIFENATPESLLATLRAHVETVKEHFGELATFDAVNEAIEDKTDMYLRDTKWKAVIGEDYIPKVFRVIKEVLPNTALYYNDYNECNPEKREKILRLMKELLAEGLVDGMGMQFHCSVYSPHIDEIKRSIEAYAALGVPIHVSELDVSMFGKDPAEVITAPDQALLEKQAEVYGAYFKLFREYAKHIDAVTFWGVADDDSWLNNFPVRGRRNWPLLFNDAYEPKEAFYRIMDF